MPTDTNATLYFAYGSNLSPTQMAARCPTSPLLGVAHLPEYSWVINGRGYANVVSSERTSAESNVVLRRPAKASAPPSAAPASAAADLPDGVFGLVYTLPASDEARLDRAEGVPDCYGKEWLRVRVWPLDPARPRIPAASSSTTTELAAARNVPDPFFPAGRAHADAATEASKTAAVPEGAADVDGDSTWRTALVYVDRERIAPGVIQPEYVARMQRACMEAAERGVPDEWLQRIIRPWLEAER